MTGLVNSGSTLSQRSNLHILFFLRFIQLGSVTITGFIYCYLVWHHRNHYCSYRPQQCTAEEMSHVKVPWEFTLVITACILAFLESYISTAFFLYRQQMPNYQALFCTTTPIAAVFALAYRAICNHSSTSMYCWIYQPQSLKANVEEKNCIIGVDGYVSLSISVLFTGFIFLMSALVLVSRSEPKIMSSIGPFTGDRVDVWDKEKDPVKCAMY